MLPGSEVGKSEVPSRKLKKISWWNKGCPKGFFGKNCKRKRNCANSGHGHGVCSACLCAPGRCGRFCHLR
ncbi:Multiple epidermal growth factor-like domains protein 6 [Manis javanica]|nr:Multiple epidermal growth factor-like domains protein 6 [Manis javanica]